MAYTKKMIVKNAVSIGISWKQQKKVILSSAILQILQSCHSRRNSVQYRISFKKIKSFMSMNIYNSEMPIYKSSQYMKCQIQASCVVCKAFCQNFRLKVECLADRGHCQIIRLESDCTHTCRAHSHHLSHITLTHACASIHLHAHWLICKRTHTLTCNQAFPYLYVLTHT